MSETNEFRTLSSTLAVLLSGDSSSIVPPRVDALTQLDFPGLSSKWAIRTHLHAEGDQGDQQDCPCTPPRQRSAVVCDGLARQDLEHHVLLKRSPPKGKFRRARQWAQYRRRREPSLGGNGPLEIRRPALKRTLYGRSTP